LRLPIERAPPGPRFRDGISAGTHQHRHPQHSSANQA
jgi:hypothetical protein